MTPCDPGEPYWAASRGVLIPGASASPVDFRAVTSGPLPPHERSWRHPSELAPPAPEPTSRSGRVLIVSAATLSLLLVGMMALSMTPDRLGPSDEAVGSGVEITLGRPVIVDDAAAGASLGAESELTAAVASVMAAGQTPGSLMAAPPPAPAPMFITPATPDTTTPTRNANCDADATMPAGTEMRFPVPVSSGWGDSGPTDDSASALPPDGMASTTTALAVLTTSPSPVVTPFGVDGMAVTTGRAVVGRPDSFSVSLPSGEVTDAHLVAVTGDVAVVELCACNVVYRRYEMASTDNTVPDHVLVMTAGAEIAVDPASLPAMHPQEGAPVMDVDGRIVGLYTYGPPAADQTGAVLDVASVVDTIEGLTPTTTVGVTSSALPTVDTTTSAAPTVVSTTTLAIPLPTPTTPTSTTVDAATTNPI
ncbi:hypothetical protein BH24ACT5_BH24ACT5_29210 [soil metagenome]